MSMRWGFAGAAGCAATAENLAAPLAASPREAKAPASRLRRSVPVPPVTSTGTAQHEQPRKNLRVRWRIVIFTSLEFLKMLRCPRVAYIRPTAISGGRHDNRVGAAHCRERRFYNTCVCGRGRAAAGAENLRLASALQRGGDEC